MKITDNTVASIHYIVLNEDREDIDASDENEPLRILIGHHQLIPGLEQALIGREAGEKFEVEVEPAQAYGEYNPALCQEVSLDLFEGQDIQPGMQFRATTDHGEQSVIVTEVNDDVAVVDGNHPLSGMTLIFKVDIVDVRFATDSEIDHGHVH